MSTPEQISLAVTAYQEHKRGAFSWIKECVAPAAKHSLVREIVVVNDGTSDFGDLDKALAYIPKLTIYQNATRLHVFANKLESVYQATSEWVLLCDSDNMMSAEYYERLASIGPWKSKTWHCASQARPAFDYRPLCGTWNLADISRLVAIKGFWCFVNTGNQFVHRERFLEVFGHLRGKRFDLEQPDYFGADDRTDEKWFLAYGAQDSFFLVKEWLLHGGVICCVDGLEYDHRIGCGDLSNYERAPIEKSALGPAYYLEMLDAAYGAYKHSYQFIRFVGSIEREYRRDDGRIVTVNLRGGVTVGRKKDNER